MKEQKTPPEQSTITFGNSLNSLVNVREVHTNTGQAIIITTEDKVRIHLSNHINKMERKKTWIAPLGILITIIIALQSTEFKKPGFLFSPDTWYAMFIISAILSGAWLLFTRKDALKSESIDDLIKRLKTGEN